MVIPSSTAGVRVRLAGLFVLITLGFALFRQAPFFIWNDSHRAFRGAEKWAQGPPSPGTLLTVPFQSTSGPGYRPLSDLFALLSHRFLYVPDGPSVLHLLLIGSIYGALAVCLVGVARRFVRHERTAYFTVLLVLASPPLAATSWVFLVGVQAVVPLLACLALLSYWRAREPRGRWFFLGLLGVLFLLAPWYREFLGIVPILIGFLEWQRARKATPLMAFAAAGLLHAIYPTALVKWLFFPDLPLKSVFALGNLAFALREGFRWEAPAYFLPLFPPLLWLVCLGSGLAGSWERLRVFLNPEAPGKETAPGTPGRRSPWPALAFAGWLGIGLALLITGGASWLLPLILCLGVAVIGLQQDVLLSFWFLAAFLPIMRVFREHIHFLYAVVPAAIILAGAAEALWLRAAAWRGWAPWARPGLAVCLAVAAADQAAILYGVYAVNRATYGGIEDVARWMTRHIPPGSAVVSNVIHGEEIKWHAGSHFEHYLTRSAGFCDPSRVVGEAVWLTRVGQPGSANAPDLGRLVEDPARLKELLVRSIGNHVYYLEVDFDYLPWKAGYHRHKYIHAMVVPRQDLGIIHKTRASYVFFDPLRHLIPRRYVPFLGAPDLVDDFYCGRSPKHRPFIYKVNAVYHLYRATGTTIRPKPAEGAYPDRNEKLQN